MKSLNAKTRVRLISLIFITAVFAVWGLFYFIISGYISDRTNRQMAQAAGQIIERFGGEFSQIERLTHSLTQNADVAALVKEQGSHEFFMLAGEIDSMPEAMIISPDFIDSVVLFGTDNNFYRLIGRLGNRACMRLASVISDMSMPSHLSVELENRRYIGYVDAVISPENEQTGAVVVLVEEERVLELLQTYDQSGLLLVAISANNEIITANTSRLYLFYPDSKHQPMIHSRLGITPYRISVTADEAYMRDSLTYFNVVAFITAAIIIIVLLVYTSILNRSFSDREKQKALMFSLKKQINAHFTINTLNTVRILVEHGEFERAETVTMGLSSLVRYAYDQEELINIWDELKILEDYIFIMNSRYNGKLEVDFDFDDRLMDYFMPRMLLQPIIENSILHGFKEMESGCIISVKAEMNDGRAAFTVKDNGCGIKEGEMARLKDKLREEPSVAADSAKGYESIAVLNIKNRLFHYFGEKGEIYISSNGSEGVSVYLQMPLMEETGELQ